MQVLLWERNFDPGILQRPRNRGHYLALQLKPCILVSRPKAKLKIQRAIAKTEKISCWWPLTYHVGIRLSDLDEQSQNAFRIRAIGYAYRHINTPPLRG
jgi:hypothetical protein